MNRLATAALLALGAMTGRARADATFAETAYKQAEQLAAAGKWAEACPLYEASYTADPKLGGLLHLAVCHEHIGRTASAYAEFSDAAELAHRTGDSREAGAKKHADALAPRLGKLRLLPPTMLIPGLTVRRDGTDITVLVGTEMPTDPGDHEIIASAPGRVEWKTKVTIATGTTTVDVPVLDKVVEQIVPPPAPVFHEGSLKVSTLANATIMLDGKPVGTGSYETKLTPGGHTLRVVAAGMRPYQSEILVGDNELRSIDVPLEKEIVAVIVAPAPPALPAEDLPAFEVGLSVAPGQKRHGDNPAVIAYRLELALRLGRRVNLGAFVEAASVSASGACGTDIAGPNPSTPYDFGMRTQFTSCRYIMPGLQLYIHILPKRRLDPYLGVAPGFRFGFIDYTTYSAAGMPLTSQSGMFPGIAVGVRAGLDYHPTTDYPGWEVGGFVDTQFMVIGDENFDNTNDKGKSYLSLFGGVRSTLQF